MDWLELKTRLLNLETELQQAHSHAQKLLLESAHRLRMQKNTSFGNWLHSSKRKTLLELFISYNINQELSSTIDEAFSEAPEQILKFISPNLCIDLLALLEEQLKDFAAIIQQVASARTLNSQEHVLSKLLGDPECSDSLLFDVFTPGLASISEFEICLAGIATCVVMCA
ncbi:MAG: hypothetical protein R2865_01780 [Deinococcales bacterium]